MPEKNLKNRLFLACFLHGRIRNALCLFRLQGPAAQSCLNESFLARCLRRKKLPSMIKTYPHTEINFPQVQKKLRKPLSSTFFVSFFFPQFAAVIRSIRFSK
jgi:hypothetical protein